MSRTDGFKLDEETEFSESLPNQDIVKQVDTTKAATSDADSKDDEVVDFVVEENVNDIPKRKKKLLRLRKLRKSRQITEKIIPKVQIRKPTRIVMMRL